MFSLKKLSPTITDMIRFDHSHVMHSFHQYKSSKSPTIKKALGESIASALDIHATLEEEIFYPVIRQLNGSEKVIMKSQPEHDEMRRIIAELRITDAAENEIRYDELMHDLMRDVMHHVADEESVLLPEAENMLSTDRLRELGSDMTLRRLALAAPQAGKMAANTAIGFSGSKTAMAVGVTGLLLAAGLMRKRAAATHS